MKQVGFEFSNDAYTIILLKSLKDQITRLSKNTISIVIIIALLMTLILGFLYYELTMTALNFLMDKVQAPGSSH